MHQTVQTVSIPSLSSMKAVRLMPNNFHQLIIQYSGFIHEVLSGLQIETRIETYNEW